MFNNQLSNREQINAMLFGSTSNRVLDYFKQQYNKVEEVIQKVNPIEYGSNMLNSVRNTLSRTFDNRYIRNVNSFLQKHRKNIVRENDIHSIGFNKLDKIVHTPRTKQYLMASPYLLNEFRIGNISGYNGSFVDYEPNVDPVWRDDYLQAVDGIVMHRGDDSYFINVVTNNEVNELSIAEQTIIMDNWNLAQRLLKKGIDPTK